ncbi:hypothetical protein M0D68_14200 [Paraburkholderia sp. SEWSISQ10-3 4]|uniref:hypothetical protein n=1 Tax=Paraburkholderia TaxID=1822464 RepID=UPI0022520006|nr:MULTISPECIES: hypothetical protein [Paraburkholderia]MCX4139342.1 hypothetical protein [Paraburkholderia aspalathi]MDN7172030.1 hypothetical protein [Paraburkholderia sp. SEWSISQ10-3 4]MDQ6501669.1 hypothetical protein [Paraburkholderia aspalathi]
MQTKTLKFACTDDEKNETIRPLLDSLTRSVPELTIERVGPYEFSELVRALVQARPDGIILDLRLDELVGPEGHRVDFRGLSVAQELRTRMTERKMNNAPIVLWSVLRNFNRSYRGDLTGHDLFDAVYDKEEDVQQDPGRVARELVSLHDAYTKLSTASRPAIYELLGLTVAERDLLDPRYIDYVPDPNGLAVHELARRILATLVVPRGPLIDEQLLAAKLGVDRDASRGDWGKLLERLREPCAYTGIFAGGWPRWWAHRLATWWDSELNSPDKLQRTTAADRVRLLKKKFSLRLLRASEPIEEGYSTCFSTVCRVFEKPLDPIDGIRIVSGQSHPFQDFQYISLKAALERKYKQKKFVIESLELSRLERIKDAKKSKK